MTSEGGHNKFDTCEGCPHRKRGIFEGKAYDCHDHCEGFKFRQKELKEFKEKVNERKYEQGIEYIAWLKERNS